MLKYIIAIVVFSIVFGSMYVRLAPVDLSNIHVPAQERAPGNYTDKGGFTAARVITKSPEDMMAAINRVILKTPRTERVAGDIGTEVMTYRSRSAIIGFPDFATVSFVRNSDHSLMIIKSGLVYGIMDGGVNERRVKQWIEQLGDLTVAL